MGNRDERPRDGSEIVRTGAQLATVPAGPGVGPESGGASPQRRAESGRGELVGLVKLVLKGVLEAEMRDHLGYERGDRAGQGSGNSRNGSSRKRVLTDVGPVDIEVPRDRAGSFEPAIVPKHQRRVEGFARSGRWSTAGPLRRCQYL